MASGLPPLLLWHGRRRVRSAAAIAFAALALAGTQVAVLLPAGDGRAATATETVLLLVGLFAGLVAVGSAGAHPADRASGDAPYVTSLALPAPARRAAPAIVGAGLALAAGMALALAAWPLLAAAGGGVATWTTQPRSAAEAGDGGTRIDAGPGAGTLEVDLRPRFRDLEAAALGTVPARIATERGEEERPVPVRGATRVEVPGGPVTLRSADPRVELRVTAARRIGAPASPAANFLRAALLVALAGALGAPLAVLLSRGLSAPTAAAGAGLLLLVGAAAPSLSMLAADAAGVAGGGPAAAVLRAAVAVAPDLSPAGAAAEAAAGRALAWGTFGGLGFAALHALACLALAAFLPSRADGA